MFSGSQGCQQALLDFVHKYMTHMGAIGSTISGINVSYTNDLNPFTPKLKKYILPNF